MSVPENHLEVGITEDCLVVVNHPHLDVDANGHGHIIFTPKQARAFALLLLKKACECDGLLAVYEVCPGCQASGDDAHHAQCAYR